MIRNMKALAAGGLLLLLAACMHGAPVGTTQNTDFSPREEARQVQDVYVILLTAADAAGSTGKLSASVLKQIDVTSQAATDAEHAYVAEAKKCWRDSTTGIVGDAPGLPEGQHCEPDTVKRLLSSFTLKTGALKGVLTAFGIDTKGADL